MVDTPDPDKQEPTEDSAQDLDTDWGADWASAFEAEEHIFSAQDADGDEFFLEDTLTKGETVSPGSDQKQTSSEATQATQGTVQADMQPETIQKKKFSFSVFFTFFTQPPAKHFALYGLPVVVLLTVLAIFIFSGDKTETKIPAPPSDPQVQPATTDITLPHIIPAIPAPPAEAVKELPPLPAGPVKHNVMKKWDLPSFVIPVAAEEGDKKISFFFIDLTLIAAVEENDELPSEKRKIVREIIYQFYMNRPLHELRRYSLARGEMNRKLLAWLKKQWPDNPIASIQFNAYRMS